MTISLDSIKFDKSNNWIKPNTFYLAKHGSHAYGLNTELSDIDLRGVAFANTTKYIGMFENFEQFTQNGDYDVVIFEFQKFLKLCANSNPNYLEILFVPDSCIVHQTPMGEKLRAFKENFLSKKIRFTLSGYAHSQLKRINGHHKWLKNPPKASPTRESYGLPDYRELSKDKLEAALSVIRKDMEEWDFNWDNISNEERIALTNEYENHLLRFHVDKEDYKFFENTAYKLGYDSNFIEVLVKEKQYRAANKEFIQYEEWKAKRNPKRAELEAKFFYDTKHASHLVRLMRMCKEVLLTGKLNVDRTNIDKEELLAIKNKGIWTYEQLIEWSTKQEQEIAEIYKTCTILPNQADTKLISEFSQTYILQHIHKQLIEKENMKLK